MVLAKMTKGDVPPYWNAHRLLLYCDARYITWPLRA